VFKLSNPLTKIHLKLKSHHFCAKFVATNYMDPCRKLKGDWLVVFL